MRIKLKEWGNMRVVKRFTLFPLLAPISNHDKVDSMAIWLETVYVEQIVTCNNLGLLSWKNRRLATRDEYLEYRRWKREEKQ